MGTMASMSVSILVESRLWGLISCHNARPRQVNAQLRTACDLLGKVVSAQLAASEQGTYARRRIELKRVEVDLLGRLAAAKSFPQGLVENPAAWLQLCAADGAAVLTEGALLTAGHTPPAERLRALADALRNEAAGEVFTTSALALQRLEFADLAAEASGVLYVLEGSRLGARVLLQRVPAAVRCPHRHDPSLR